MLLIEVLGVELVELEVEAREHIELLGLERGEKLVVGLQPPLVARLAPPEPPFLQCCTLHIVRLPPNFVKYKLGSSSQSLLAGVL